MDRTPVSAPNLRLLLFSLILLTLPLIGLASSKEKKNDRPKLPYNMMGLGHDELDAYDSKAEPVADVTAALVTMNRTGWELVHQYFPTLGSPCASLEKKVHPDDPLDPHFLATNLSEDATSSPLPLLSAVWSLPGSTLSGRVKTLHDALDSILLVEDYSTWKLDALRESVTGMTDAAKTAQGVKYRTPKKNLQFKQALRLYAMTVALVRAETKWADKADSPPPDMHDFANRLSHQLPVKIADGETVAFFLYRPGIMTHPLSKGEVEERADVVVMTRSGSSFQGQQFPVYLTADQKEWNPSWIEPRDEMSDTTLTARKFEHGWTRLDGPYVWFWPDQLNGKVLYRATLTFAPDNIVIEAERDIESRGGVKRADRPRDYDPKLMTAFAPDIDSPAGPPNPLAVDPPSIEDQLRSLKTFRHFSNAFRAWCAYGLSTSGLGPDGKTWIAIVPDPPRPDGPDNSR